MDFVCYCGTSFTLNSSLQRHYQLCKVARDIALQSLQTTAHVNIPAPRGDSAVVPHTSNPGSTTTVPHGSTLATRVAVDGVGQQLQEKMTEREHYTLEAFAERMATQNGKFISSIAENHVTFLQAFTKAQVQQNTEF
ncbi:hypothetical protein EDD21DRAFT_359085 [Dissophora ornata]|nr:hypothetical protein EDD21DRAFT_359085 [Dissophora ornata]